MVTPVSGNKFTINDVISSIGDGWIMFWEIPGVSIAYTSIFALSGLILLSGIGMMGLSPMALPFAGGFMLIGPILLSGFFTGASTTMGYLTCLYDVIFDMDNRRSHFIRNHDQRCPAALDD